MTSSLGLAIIIPLWRLLNYSVRSSQRYVVSRSIFQILWPLFFFLTDPWEEENGRARGVESLSEKKANRDRREARLKHSQCEHSAPLSAASAWDFPKLVHICKALQPGCPRLTGQSPFCLNTLSYGFTWPTLLKPFLHLVCPYYMDARYQLTVRRPDISDIKAFLLSLTDLLSWLFHSY